MTNDEKFQKVFGYYASEMWAKPEKEFLEWANSEALQQGPVNTLKQIPEVCKNCSNHPSNGGSGICFCTLGSMTTT